MRKTRKTSSLLNSELPRRGGPSTAEGKAKSLSNLKPFPPGQSGNTEGRPSSAGLSVAEWMNAMKGWSRQQLRDALSDDASPADQVVAACRWLNACDPDKPNSGAEADRIFDRTHGKPAQPIEVTGKDGGDLKIVVEYVDACPPKSD